jgi:hypothetical protein
LLDVRASENVEVKPIPLDGYGYDAHRYKFHTISSSKLQVEPKSFLGCHREDEIQVK